MENVTTEIYLGDLTGDVECIVGFVHHKPFDPVEGFQKTREELEQTGVLVDALPELEIPEGKQPTLYYNRETKELWYEYSDPPVEPIDAIGQEVARLKFENLQKDMIIQMFGQEMTAMKLELMQLKSKGGE